VSGSGGDRALPAAVRVDVAYEVRRGNPFAHYQTLDFELDRAPIECVASQAEILRRQGNELVFRPQAGDFQVQLAGFHAFRDLRVRVKTIDGVTR
jgi:hypothetical protein